jgi:hypothetical protein
MRAWISSFVFLVSACATAPAPNVYSSGGQALGPEPAQPTARPTRPPPPNNGFTPSAGSSPDAPEISRSVGQQGGFVLLWPRVLPKGDAAARDYASRLQQQLRSIVEKASPGKPVDIRPDPERSCPREGCAATGVSFVFTRDGTSCAAVALVTRPGTSPTQLVPWIGKVRLKQTSVPFREPPEPQISVDDFVECSKLAEKASASEADLIAAIRSAAGG